MFELSVVTPNLPTDEPVTIMDDFRRIRRDIQADLCLLDGVRKAVAGVVDDTMIINVHGGEREAVDQALEGRIPAGLALSVQMAPI